MNCEKCIYFDDGVKMYFECCCEYDKNQVKIDDENAKKAGYKPVLKNGEIRWIKKNKNVKH
jgi:hypothetical protein